MIASRPGPTSDWSGGQVLEITNEELQRTRGRTDSQTLYDPCFGHDVPLAINTVEKLQQVDCRDDVFVIIAHDRVVRDMVDHFPNDLNDWKERGWGKTARWGWLQDLETHFTEKGVLKT